MEEWAVDRDLACERVAVRFVPSAGVSAGNIAVEIDREKATAPRFHIHDLRDFGGEFGDEFQRKESRVYALLKNFAVIYIGSAIDTRSAIARHRREKRMTFDTVWSLGTSINKPIAKLLIAHFRPLGNYSNPFHQSVMDGKFARLGHYDRYLIIKSRIDGEAGKP